MRHFRRLAATATVVACIITLQPLAPSRATAATNEAIGNPDGETTNVRPGVDAPRAPATFDPDHVLVKFKDDADPATIAKYTKRYQLAPASDLGSDIDMLTVGTSDSPKTVAANLTKAGIVDLAEPDYDIKPDAISNDAQVEQFWGLRNDGQNIGGQSGAAGVDVDAPDAWPLAEGDGVIVGVLDEGIDINHPELASHIWTNSRDCDNDGRDDDNDGYVDDCHGWDFLHNDNSVYDYNDGDDHGTHVAGTIAASVNNNIGGAGVAPNVTLMPLKFLGPTGGSTSDAIKAIAFAKAHGVRILNCSWGGSAFSQALQDAIADSGILFTVSAGNSGNNIGTNKSYPASFDLPNVITVAAVDNKGALASFSNYGGTTSVAAPGVNVLSTLPKRQNTAIGIDNTAGSWRSGYLGFGLEAVVGAAARRDLLSRELSRLGATTASPVLLVDDDESSTGSGLTPDTERYYLDALADGGYTNVSTIDVPKNANGPSSATMNNKFVIWETGYAVGSTSTYTLTTDDLTNLTAFANGGGRMLVAGSDVIWRNEASNFVQNILGVDFESEGDTRTSAFGASGTSYAGLDLDLSGRDSPKGTLNPYQDTVSRWTTQASESIQLVADPNYNQAYGYKSGTSMAAPHVAGVAALAAQLAPRASASKLADYVKRGARNTAGLASSAVKTSGIVNAANTVALAAADVTTTSTAQTASDGYRFAASDGGIFAFGNRTFVGSAGAQPLNQPVVGMASTPSNGGYWLVARDGGIFSYGDAGFVGSAGNIKLNQPIVGMAATPSGKGYWLVASDGGIFAYGDARFFGSAGATKLNQPIVGMAATPSGNGYWLVASDGGIFAYGDAGFLGSTGGTKLNQPIVGMSASPNGKGYWLVASDGGIFSYGNSAFLGSAGGSKLNQPIVGMDHTKSGNGYWLVAADGGVFAYGDAGFYGSTGAIKLNKPIVGLGH